LLKFVFSVAAFISVGWGDEGHLASKNVTVIFRASVLWIFPSRI